MARILVVDDDRNCAAFLRLFLSDEGHDVRSAVTGKEALQAAAGLSPDLLITDWLLKDGTDGLSLARALRQQRRDIHVILITGMPARELRDKIQGVEKAQIFEKPLDLDRLLPLVQELVGTSEKPNQRT